MTIYLNMQKTLHELGYTNGAPYRFPCQLNKDFKTLFKRARNLFGSEIYWQNVENF